MLNYFQQTAPGDEQPVYCPECGEELGLRDEIYTRQHSDTVAGCSQCLHRHSAVEWLDENTAAWLNEDWAADYDEWEGGVGA